MPKSDKDDVPTPTPTLTPVPTPVSTPTPVPTPEPEAPPAVGIINAEEVAKAEAARKERAEVAAKLAYDREMDGPAGAGLDRRVMHDHEVAARQAQEQIDEEAGLVDPNADPANNQTPRNRHEI